MIGRFHTASRARAGAIALLALPSLLLSACANKEDKLAEQLTAAEAAADKAVAAQRAAEKAAAIAAGIRPAPPPPEPTVMEEYGSEFEQDNSEYNGANSYSGGEFSMGGSGQTVSPDGVVIPGQGA
jgi:hypothetical protein